jgi:hypothetical protein
VKLSVIGLDNTFLLHLSFVTQANIKGFLHHQQSCFFQEGCERRCSLSADSVRRFLSSADLHFVSRFLSAIFCSQQIRFLSADVFADVMKMMLTPAYSELHQPVWA